MGDLEFGKRTPKLTHFAGDAEILNSNIESRSESKGLRHPDLRHNFRATNLCFSGIATLL
jgi:hypothetical protein